MNLNSKNKLLLLGVLLCFFLGYQLAFKKTYVLKKELYLVAGQIKGLHQQASQSKNVFARGNYADSVLSKNNFKSFSIQNNLLEFLNKQSLKTNFIISDFQEPHIITKEMITVNSYPFILKGDFKSLLGVIYSLEQDYNYGKIIHIEFEKKRDFRKRTDQLQCYVILENTFSK